MGTYFPGTGLRPIPQAQLCRIAPAVNTACKNITLHLLCPCARAGAWFAWRLHPARAPRRHIAQHRSSPAPFIFNQSVRWGSVCQAPESSKLLQQPGRIHLMDCYETHPYFITSLFTGGGFRAGASSPAPPAARVPLGGWQSC